MSGADAPKTASNPPDLPDLAVVRLKQRSQFLFVRAGESFRTKSLVIQARRRPASAASGHIGAGFTATKKIGNAVARNRAKRRLRAASEKLLAVRGLSGVDYVFIARKETGAVAWQRLLDDMEKALVSLANTLGATNRQA